MILFYRIFFIAIKRKQFIFYSTWFLKFNYNFLEIYLYNLIRSYDSNLRRMDLYNILHSAYFLFSHYVLFFHYHLQNALYLITFLICKSQIPSMISTFIRHIIQCDIKQVRLSDKVNKPLSVVKQLFIF